VSFVDASRDREFMQEALQQARTAFEMGEVPIGAVIVVDGVVIARSHNLVEQKNDATQHAEMLCLQQAAKMLGNWRLKEATLYCTLEPCPMCAGAMIHSRLRTLVWGAPDLRCGAHGSWVDLFDIVHPIHCIEVRKNILQEEAGDLMREFFRNRRSDVGKSF
jgi:tRNA(adenine34) deaminase